VLHEILHAADMRQITETRINRLNKLARLAKCGDPIALANRIRIDRTINLASQIRQVVTQAQQDVQVAEQRLEEAKAISKRIGWPDKMRSQS
jgi:hypothetical protein